MIYSQLLINPSQELDFPLGSEHVEPDVSHSVFKEEAEESPSKPSLSTTSSTAIVAILVAIILWYVYVSYFSDTREESPVAANGPNSVDADGDWERPSRKLSSFLFSRVLSLPSSRCSKMISRDLWCGRVHMLEAYRMFREWTFCPFQTR